MPAQVDPMIQATMPAPTVSAEARVSCSFETTSLRIALVAGVKN